MAGNRLLREALARTLSKKNDISVLGAVPYSSQAIDQIIHSACEVLLLDSIVAENRDLHLVRQVREIVPHLKVLLIGMEEEEELFLRAVRAGIAGYVLKEASATDVVAAVRSVASGEAVCPPKLCLPLFHYVARQDVALPSVRVGLQLGLTRREQQLLPLIAKGLTNKEIAAALNLSEQTVKNHLYRIMQKVGAQNRLGIIERCQTAEVFLH